MTASRTALLTILAQTHPTLVRLATPLPAAALDFRPTSESWSIREILAHLVDDEMFVMRTRLERMIKESCPELAPHDETNWYNIRNTARDEVSLLLADFELQRGASLNILHFLREQEWQREGFQPEYGRFTVETWLEHWAAHDTTHLRQIEHNLHVYTAQES